MYYCNDQQQYRNTGPVYNSYVTDKFRQLNLVYNFCNAMILALPTTTSVPEKDENYCYSLIQSSNQIFDWQQK